MRVVIQPSQIGDSSYPVMAAPDYRMTVDARDVGAGAESGLDYPVCFVSKMFDKHQVNYSTIEKEALAMVQALKHLQIYASIGCFYLP